MRNYVLADLKRIIKRLPRIIVMAIIYAALLAVIYAAYKNLWSSILPCSRPASDWSN